MAKFRYKNISEDDLHIMNIGNVKSGAEIESDVMIENPNLELIEEAKKEVKK